MHTPIGMPLVITKQTLNIMITPLPVKFLQQKINELQSALFVTETNSILRMPTHVVTSAEVDEAGQVWFVIPRPTQQIDAFDKSFPVKMDFFKKGKGFYIKIQGNASIIDDVQEIKGQNIFSDDILKTINDKKAIAIKVIPQNADYFENIPKPSSTNWLLAGKNHLYNWLFNSQYDYKNPQLITIPISVDHKHPYLK